MSEIINVTIDIYPIIDVLYIIPIIAGCVIGRSFLVASCILMLNVINWIKNNSNKLCTLLFYFYLIILTYIFIQIMDINSVMHCMGNEGWEENWDNINNNNSETKSKVYNSLKNADKSSILDVFKDKSKVYGNKIMNSKELKTIFEDRINKHMANGSAINKDKYSIKNMKTLEKFEALRKGLMGIKATNSHLDLNWKELCRLYAITHHRLTPFDINNINNYDAESLYTHLKMFKNTCPLWEWALQDYLKDPNKKYELYVYMRIIAYAINKNTM